MTVMRSVGSERVPALDMVEILWAEVQWTVLLQGAAAQVLVRVLAVMRARFMDQ
jgi:hypothetical protein